MTTARTGAVHNGPALSLFGKGIFWYSVCKQGPLPKKPKE